MSLTISDKTSPYPIVGDTTTLHIRGLRDHDHKVYDLSACSKIYCTVKSALTDADAAALININTSSNPTQFVTTYAAIGHLAVTLAAGNTVLLTPDTTYYIDVKALWADGKVESLVYDTIVFKQRVTRATT